jgi:arylsulfatase A-like enzyme
MKEKINKGFFTGLTVAIFFALLAIPYDLFVSLKSGSGFIVAGLLASRSSGPVFVTVFLFIGVVFFLLRLIDRLKPNVIGVPLQQAIYIGSGTFILIFLKMFSKFYDKFEVLAATEIFGGIAALVVSMIAYRLLLSGNRYQRLGEMVPKITFAGIPVIVILFGVSFIGGAHVTKDVESGIQSGKSERPNILLIVMDTVRADHLSLYGYHLNTTPYLKKMALESAVFNNAFAAAPWTLPSHASIFTGLYPSQHKTNAEHFWLDDTYRTLAEVLHDNGYQTVSFSNNDYVTSYHNMVQGFERTWYKGNWTDEIKMPDQSLGGAVVSLLNWLWEYFRTDILAKVIKNPASIWDYPSAAVTNKAVSDWLSRGRDDGRSFFMFINYMDAHFPYDPDDETAALFLNKEELEMSYRLKLRNPPIEYFLDMSKGGYTEKDIRIMNRLYDARIHYLDGELEKLFNTFKKLGMYDRTLIIIASDHGEYLGSRNRLAHGLGLHEEVLHVPLIARYPGLFKAGARYDTVVTHVDIPETILSFANITERPKEKPETQLLYDLKDDLRQNVFSESFFPLNLLVGASLRDDNSGLFVEEKTIRSRNYQFIWKSRGEPEFYNVANDPSEMNNIYSSENEKAEDMKQQLLQWTKTLPRVSLSVSQASGISKKEKFEMIQKLRALGYVK